MSNYKRVMATLSNNQSIYVYNMDVNATLTNTIVFAGQPEVNDQGQYKFSNAESGWFCSINSNDTDRTPVIMQIESGEILLEITPLKTFTTKDLAKAKPFVPAFEGDK